MKDWTGNTNSVYKIIASSNHSDSEREVNDYYATEPKATELLLEKVKFNNKVWECACGEGHIAKVLMSNGYDVFSTDLINRGFCEGGVDFLKYFPSEAKNKRDIITNPPYKFAKEFVEHAMDISVEGVKVAMFLKLTFLEGQARRKMFEKYPPKKVYVASKRLSCAKNGNFEENGSGAVAYAWFVWEKGFEGKPTIEWIN